MFVKSKNNTNNEPSKRKIKTKKVSSESKNSGESSDGDNPCSCPPEKKEPKIYRLPGLDPRFQQQNQTIRCFLMYADFFRCEDILGEGHEACTWFQSVYKTFCPIAWVEDWDDKRARGIFPWPFDNHPAYRGPSYPSESPQEE